MNSSMSSKKKQKEFKEAVDDRDEERVAEILSDKLPSDKAKKLAEILVRAPEGVGVTIDRKFFR